MVVDQSGLDHRSGSVLGREKWPLACGSVIEHLVVILYGVKNR